MTDREDILAIETRRCDAIATGNIEDLSSVLRDDYVHVFGGGYTRGKADYIKHISEVPRRPTRDNMIVRVYGDTAVLTGNLFNRIRPIEGAKPAATYGKRAPVKEDVQAFATQVLVRENGEWEFCSCQLTRCID